MQHQSFFFFSDGQTARCELLALAASTAAQVAIREAEAPIVEDSHQLEYLLELRLVLEQNFKSNHDRTSATVGNVHTNQHV